MERALPNSLAIYTTKRNCACNFGIPTHIVYMKEIGIKRFLWMKASKTKGIKEWNAQFLHYATIWYSLSSENSVRLLIALLRFARILVKFWYKWQQCKSKSDNLFGAEWLRAIVISMEHERLFMGQLLNEAERNPVSRGTAIMQHHYSTHTFCFPADRNRMWEAQRCCIEYPTSIVVLETWNTFSLLLNQEIPCKFTREIHTG